MSGDVPPLERREIVPYDANTSIYSRGLALADEVAMASGRIRVVIVDDIEDTISNLTKLLGFESDIEVVGVAFDGRTGIDLVRATEPDIVLMDICMPMMDGITAAEIISSSVPASPIIMMSVQGDQDYLRRSMLAGAREYLVKPFSADEFVNAIRDVHQLEKLRRQRYEPKTRRAG